MNAELTVRRGALEGGLPAAKGAQRGAWFAAGTVVQTDKGLLPIEQVRVGARVFSQAADTGGRDFRRVTSTVAHLDQKIYAVQIWAEGADSLNTLFATAETRFSVASQSAHGEHSVATESLTPGLALQLADGRKASVHAIGLVRRTQHAHIGFAADERTGVGMALDLSARQIKLADEAIRSAIGKLELGDAYLTPVYNFEVEEFHTYYVGESGVWVHNSACPKNEGLQAALAKSKMEMVCFPSGTAVISLGGYAWEDGTDRVPIEDVELGQFVLSRCDVTGETDFKRVTKVFNNGYRDVATIHCDYGVGSFWQRHALSLKATLDHPFWVEGKGWTKVRDLQAGDEFVTHNGAKATCEGLTLNSHRFDVFNIEVEDFHTYFAGSAGIWVHNCNHTIEPNRLIASDIPGPQPCTSG